MRILIVPDKFKGSLGADRVADCIAGGVREVLPGAVITCLPIADGGEGTATAICSAAGGEWHSCEVQDAFGAIVRARYCTIDGGQTAVMEISEACGLWRVPTGMRDPDRASSFGAGELLLRAIGAGAKKIIIGLGGSATNDGGFGLARALGFRFLDADGRELDGVVSDLVRLARIEPPKTVPWPEIIAAADVRNPLLGARGATRVFGPQKGADAAQVQLLEAALTRLADVVARDLGTDFRGQPGAGAAGGLGFGLLSFCAASVRPGFDIVAEFTNLEEAVRAADVVITGEGRLDAQTLDGKAPAGVARLARKLGKRVHAIVGAIDEAPGLRELFDGVSTLVTPETLSDVALAETATLLRERARELALTFGT
jgi:glycerate kinase